MDSLEGSIAVNQVFYAKYALRRLSSGEGGKYILNRGITREILLNKWESSGTHLCILCLVMNFAHCEKFYCEKLLFPE